MQIYIARHGKFLLAWYNIWLKCPYAVYLGMIKLICQLQNRHQQDRQKNLELNHYRIISQIITQTGTMTTDSSSKGLPKHAQK